jgi:hypothetical protein
MARRQRKDQYVVTVSGPQSDINTASTTAPLVQEVVTTSIDSVAPATIDNPQQTVEDGALPQIQGLWYEQIAVPVEVFQEGTRAVAADGQPAVLTALGHLLASCFQCTPIHTTRSKVLASPSPTTTANAESVNDGHVIGSGYTSTKVGLVLVKKASTGVNFWRMFTYTTASELLTYLIALPAALGTDDILYAGSVFQYVEQWDGLPYGVTLDITANDLLQNAQVYGAVSSLSIPAVGANESPKFNFTFKGAGGSYDKTATRGTPNYQRPLVLAGSTLTMAPFGSTVGVDVCGDVEFSIGSQWSPSTCRNLPTGLQNWKRGKGSVEVKVTVPHNVLPVTIKAASTRTSWRHALDTGIDTLWQLQSAYGQQTPGSAACVACPALRLVGVSGGEVDEGDARVLTFKPAAEYAAVYPAVIAGLS